MGTSFWSCSAAPESSPFLAQSMGYPLCALGTRLMGLNSTCCRTRHLCFNLLPVVAWLHAILGCPARASLGVARRHFGHGEVCGDWIVTKAQPVQMSCSGTTCSSSQSKCATSCTRRVASSASRTLVCLGCGPWLLWQRYTTSPGSSRLPSHMTSSAHCTGSPFCSCTTSRFCMSWSGRSGQRTGHVLR